MAKIKMVDPDEIVVVEKKVEIDDRFVEIVDLPSRFRLYSSGTKLYGRPLKVSEIKKLATMDERNANVILKDILSATIRGIDVNDICTADKIYLIFWLRAYTYTNDSFSATYHCSNQKCKSKNSYKFDVTSFEVEYLPEDYEASEFSLIKKDKKIVLDFPRIRDEDRIKAFQESLKNAVATYDEETLVIASLIKSIDGVKVNMRQACEFIASLEDFPEDYAYLYSKSLEMDFGITPELKHTCPKCGEVNSIPVSFQPSFFIPKFNA